MPGFCLSCEHTRGLYRSLRNEEEYRRAARLVKELEGRIDELDDQELERLRVGTEAIIAYEIFTGRL